jgi:hypothetical protein
MRSPRRGSGDASSPQRAPRPDERGREVRPPRDAAGGGGGSGRWFSARKPLIFPPPWPLLTKQLDALRPLGSCEPSVVPSLFQNNAGPPAVPPSVA